MKHLLRTVFVWLALLGPVLGQQLESYVINIPPGYSLIANQLDRGGNTLNEIMPVVPDGSIISFWNPTLGKYDPIATYSSLTGWSDGNLILAPGKGALFENKSGVAFPLTFTGTRRLMAPVAPELSVGGLYLISIPTPSAGNFNELGFPVPCGQIRILKMVGGGQFEQYLYDPDSGGWNPSVPSLSVGEAFYLENTSPCPGGPLFGLLCPDLKSVECGTDWTFDLPTVQGACEGSVPVVGVVNTVTNGSCPLQITRIYEASDNCGNRATCTQTVTVTDNTPPQLVCAPDKSVECGADWSFDPPTATDPCSAQVTINVLSTVTNGACPIEITRSYEALDACGNRATCSQKVTVTDNTPPQLVCAPDKSVECGSDWSFDAPTATDSCSSQITINVLSTVTNGACPATIIRVYEVTDACGNRATCSQTVNLTQPPKGDLYMEDTPYNYNGTPDSGLEPEPAMTGQSMWMSRAIWVHQNYTQLPETYVTHQNPRYGQTNAILVKVGNRGQGVVRNAKLMVYVANASLGLSWPGSWTLIDTYDLQGIEPGTSHIAKVPWKPDGTGHYCLLARIFSDEDPMAKPETNSVSANVRANNNLAWRNVNVVNLLLTTGQSAEVRVKPVRNQPRVEVKPGQKPPRLPVTVQCKTEALFHEGAGEATLHLGPWFKRWQDAGGRGQGFEHIGDNAIRLTNTLVRLEDIPMDDDEEAIINLVVRAPHPMPIAGTEHTCHVELTEEIDGEAVGGVNYGVLVRALHTDTDHDGIVDVDDPDDDGDGVSDVDDPDPLGEPDCPPSALTIRYVDGDMVVSWNGLGYQLQATSELGRPWHPIQKAVSPYVVAPTGQARFFRLVCH